MKLCFVVPRFAESIAGGAETLVGSLAPRVAKLGHQVKVITTCAKDNRTWDNFFPAGSATEYGVSVERFAVDPRDLESWVPKQIAISEGMNLSIDDQLSWMKDSVNSSELYRYIAEHQNEYDYFIFAPYLFGTTFWGALICPEKSILIPCLHDESYAYIEIMSVLFRKVAGCLFNADAEQRLAERLFGGLAGQTVAMGFELHPEDYLNTLDPYFSEQFPYLLYLGRKETGKNVHLLVDYFIEYKKKFNNNLKFVIAGGGSFSDLGRNHALQREDIIDLQHVSELEKHQLIKHALILCQPSTNESFSIVLMESWLLGRPVLVNANCQVTRDHVVESAGGLYFADQLDFIAVLNYLNSDPQLSDQLGSNGFNYVKNKYNWQAVLDRFETALSLIKNHERSQQAH